MFEVSRHPPVLTAVSHQHQRGVASVSARAASTLRGGGGGGGEVVHLTHLRVRARARAHAADIEGIMQSSPMDTLKTHSERGRAERVYLIVRWRWEEAESRPASAIHHRPMGRTEAR